MQANRWPASVIISNNPSFLLNSMPKTSATEPKSFEAAMAELDTLVEKMDAGQLALEDSLSAYQRGAELIEYCERILADAQQRIQVLDSASDTLKDFEA
jgi:exodeoxyribonuclease VII small subunit